MAEPGEHKTVQARVLQYAHEVGWTFVPRGETEARRGFDPDRTMPEGGHAAPVDDGAESSPRP